jgi:signal peptidase II
VLGGAIGNVIDRLHYHFVVDFIRIIPLPIFEVFNIADTAISIGIVSIVIACLTRDEPPNETTQ